jgi:gamma-glutamyltranspeptidase / glutathione hydrolase
VRLAEEGILLREDEAQRFAAAAEELSQHPGSRAAYLKPDGTPYAPGERLRQPALARTIRAMAEEGIGTFYRGWIADSIHADMVRSGGFITREELAAYEALPAIAASGTYRGYAVHSNFRPASGHSVVQALQMMEAVGVPGRDAPAEWAAVVGQAMGLALADRAVRAGSEAESARQLTSRSHALERAREVRVPEESLEAARVPVGAGVRSAGAGWAATGVSGTGAGVAAAGAGSRAGTAGAGARAGAAANSAWTEAGPGWLPPSWSGSPWAPDDREATTHFAVVDRDGMVVSVTQSLGPAVGTRLVTPGLGFLYATRLGSTPGSRPSSTISPTIVVRPDGTPYFALGGAGDARIVSAVIQVISRVIDHGLPLRDAVAAPRVHPGTEASGLFVETGPVAAWPDAVLDRLRSHGFGLDVRDSGYFGRVHAVALEGDAFLGVAEPRWRGGAAGPRR